MMWRASLLPLLLALGACGALPRDAAGTTERIAREHVMRVAVLPGTPDAAPAVALLDAYAAKHRARLMLVAAHGEHAARQLEEGRIDALVGHFAKASPWMTDISLSKAVGRREPDDSRQPVLRIARRNGENALILATDRAIAAMAQ
ncbi:hypothetical protein [Sphingopyxis sp. JAI128]|uniref:hypothetical protein n=1 Tax=Sphingopyxis sp. JAI128 TaxID=2723066 RepID=UPI00160E26CF|nr:hypothetical protein [Sphingopyxis sp. JAI128]MBB6424655.1 ABC-type amino acid transport substrate-binding protein [Sphingopyxis sp. JAI128]